MPIDETDRKIIAVLDRDASLTYKEIGRRLKMNESTVRKRVLSLTKKKVIRFVVQIDTSQLGFKTEAWLGVDAEPHKSIAVGNKLTDIPGVRMLFSTNGEHDFGVVIWAADRHALSKIIEEVSAVDGVTKVVPSVTVDRLK